MTDENRSESGILATSGRLFVRGLAALLPTLVTLLIIIKLTSFIHDYFGRYIAQGIVEGAAWADDRLFMPTYEQVAQQLKARGIDPAEADRPSFRRQKALVERELRRANISALSNSWQMAIVGFIAALVIVCIMGFLLASLIGRRLWRRLEETFISLPIIKQIYPHVKQVTDYVFGPRRAQFSQVVLVEYPRKGIWSIGLVTGGALRQLRDRDPAYMSIFIPSSPTPLTGYVITAHKDDTIELTITIDQALRYVISGGVIRPETNWRLAGADDEQER